MKIIHIGFDAIERGGAGIAMLRIHRSLKKIGINSQIVCRRAAVEEGSSILPCSISKRLQIKMLNACMKIVYGRAYPVNVIKTGMANYVNSLNPDVVQLHWLQGDTISIEEIAAIRAPIVWMLHDMWPFSGVDASPQTRWYKEGYPRGTTWVDRWTWERKKKVFGKLPIFPVGASQWVVNEAQNSIVFKGHCVTKIPLPIDLEIFKKARGSKERNRYFTVLFGATTGIRNSIKGFDRLEAALGCLNNDEKSLINVKVFGETRNPIEVSGVSVSFLGKIASVNMLDVYNQADVFVFPSRQETFGQTKLEALASGVPVIAFNESACAEGIDHKVTGWVAKSNDIKDFAEGIRWAMRIWKGEIEYRNAEYLDSVYSELVVAQQWLALYKQIITKQESPSLCI